ncbi:MAG: MMPL family transporter [Corynebacterium sp.]|nr:MMPL family transporter [Corynebacterium sp.]
MANFLYKVGRTAYLHKWRFFAAWLIILIGFAAAFGTMRQQTSTTFTIEGMESIETNEEIQEIFGMDDALNGATGTVIIKAPEGKKLTDPEVMETVDDFIADLQAIEDISDPESIINPVYAAQGMSQQMTETLTAQGVPQEQIDANLAAVTPLSADATIGTIDIAFDAETAMDVTDENIETFEKIVDEYATDGYTIAYGGNVFQPSEVSATSELIGLAVATIILIITFGALITAGLPLITAVLGLSISLLGVYAATYFTNAINSMTPTLASMIGLAVGIDYSLFILARYRSELVRFLGGADLSPQELQDRMRETTREQRADLMGIALGKAGSAVVFAGSTVIIALLALRMVNIPFLTAMTYAAAWAVLMAVLVALTFLPALVGTLGLHTFGGRITRLQAPDPEREEPVHGLRWVRRIRKRPALYAIVSVLILGILAIPVTQMRLAMPTDAMASAGSPQRIANDLTDEGFGPGRNAPMLAMVTTEEDDPQAAMLSFQGALTTLNDVEGVENAQIIQMDEENAHALLLITPDSGATDERTSETLEHLRDAEADYAADFNASYVVTGTTPIFDDISERLSEVLIPYLLIVIGLAFILLVIVFRSLWVPLIATLGFALSVAATFGITVGIWQEGYLGLVSDTQPLISFLPIMLIGIIFGLAMDYQVFLVSRMREGWSHGKTAANATSNGFKHGARVVTAAALIMISVFAAFMLMDEQFIKVMGFALAAAIFFDAFLVRMTLIPATMFLLGERAWYFPKWLDKILPHADVEGESLESPEPLVLATANSENSDDTKADASSENNTGRDKGEDAQNSPDSAAKD